MHLNALVSVLTDKQSLQYFVACEDTGNGFFIHQMMLSKH